MRGLNLKPARVYQTASLLLETQTISVPPPWYSTIQAIPPGEFMVRTQPPQHNTLPKRNRKIRKPSKLFAPQRLEYEEDRLRKTFYQDHPWELARPRIVLENDGKDGQRVDWSKGVMQPGRQLNGESVVQRQLYLLSSDPSLTVQAAYDIARKEFYFHRHLSELETRIQKEEALWTGAYFGKTALQIGLELEDKSYEDWRLWADKQIKEEELKRAGAYGGQQMMEDEEMEGVDGAAEEADDIVDEVVDDGAPPPAM